MELNRVYWRATLLDHLIALKFSRTELEQTLMLFKNTTGWEQKEYVAKSILETIKSLNKQEALRALKHIHF